jgi:hypothetical protein
MGERTTTTALQKNANSLYTIPTDKLSAVQSIFTTKQLQLLHQVTPAEHIHKFPSNAGAMAGLAFVTGGYMKHMLDRLTGGMWSFEVKEKGNTSGQIWVLGRLTLYKPDGSSLIFKEQFGRAKIKYKTDHGKPTDQPMDIGNDMKAATTDALKKCASELGIARDIYAANEFIEAEIVDRADVEDIEQEEVVEEQKKNETFEEKVDETYKKYVQGALMKQFPTTFERMQFIKEHTSKISLEKLNDYDWQYLCAKVEELQLEKVNPDTPQEES